MSQEQIENFIAITNAGNESLAKDFLSMAGGNLDMAISLFFEHGGNAQLHNGRVRSESNSNSTSVDTDQIDADLAQRLQNEAYQEEDAVRPPDAARHETLTETHVFPGTFGGVGGSFAPLNNSNDMFDNTRPTGVFNQRLDDDYENDLFRPRHNPGFDDSDSDSDSNLDSDRDSDFEYVEEPIVELDDDGHIREYTKLVRKSKTFSKEERLTRLFRPPFDIISKLSIDDARLKARKKKKWLMINIQDSGIFQCQVLNRDLWSHKYIKRLIKKSFVFLQYQFESRSAEPYRNFYNLQSKNNLPHIAILDPITGERLKQWNETVPNPENFIDDVNKFLQQFSLDPSSTNPTIKEPPKPIDPTTLTEEQQMELAIQQSLGTTQQNPISITNDTNEERIDSKQVEQANEKKDDFDQIELVKHEEPANKLGITTRIQIRTGDGKRFIRRFDATTDTVRVVYEVIKTEMEGYDICKFILSDHKRHDLIEKLNMTIEDAGLKNSSLLLEKVEDDEN